MGTDDGKVEEVIDRYASKAKPGDIAKIDRQFEGKLADLENKAPADMVAKLRTLWAMLKLPDSEVPFTSKALIMAALSYFVAPFDVIPDALGKAGYLDDAQVIRLVYSRLGDEIAAFERTHK
jgi:uncharacterized membrane protein YkvA (DUF1232 family)